MTVKTHRSLKKVAFGNGYIDWVVMFAVDENGLVQAKVWGSDYELCLRDMKCALEEIKCAESCWL